MKTIFIVYALNESKWFSCHLQKWAANEMQRSHETKWITCDSVFNFFAIKDFHTTTLTKCDRLAKSPQVDILFYFTLTNTKTTTIVYLGRSVTFVLQKEKTYLWVQTQGK
jgi:hypothetical protein